MSAGLIDFVLTKLCPGSRAACTLGSTVHNCLMILLKYLISILLFRCCAYGKNSCLCGHVLFFLGRTWHMLQYPVNIYTLTCLDKHCYNQILPPACPSFCFLVIFSCLSSSYPISIPRIIFFFSFLFYFFPSLILFF